MALFMRTPIEEMVFYRIAPRIFDARINSFAKPVSSLTWRDFDPAAHAMAFELGIQNNELP